MRPLPHTRSCFFCGEDNPFGLRLRFETDGRIVRTRFTPSPGQIGFQNVTHGGILATVLDEIMVWACAVATRRFAYCAELTTRFHQPARPDSPLSVTAELVENRRGRVLTAKADILDTDGQKVASASGRYRPILPALVPGMLSDVVGDVSWIEGIEPDTK